MLPEEHRRAQVAIRNASLGDLKRLYRAFDLEHINATWPALEGALLALIRRRGATSGGVATRFYQQIRRDSRVRGVATPTAAAPDEEVILKGLRVVGPANAALQLAKKVPLELVKRNTLTNLAGEVTRQVLEHGRMSLIESLIADQERNRSRPGVQRITSGSPCPWCAEQATEIYPPTERFPAHMHCSCFPSPVFQ